MPLTRDDDVMAALPVLRPLMKVASLPISSWSRSSDASISSVTSDVANIFPLTCYRTETQCAADVASLHTVLCDASLIARYDPGVEEVEVVLQDRCNTLLYTRYRAPSWLIAPRDFCVQSTSVCVATEKLDALGLGSYHPARRVVYNGGTTMTGQGQSLHHGSKPVVFLQNSVSYSSPLCPPHYHNHPECVRAHIYSFGYIAWWDPESAALRIENYSCVDPLGSIPKWLVAMAVSENLKKVNRIAALAVDCMHNRGPKMTTITVGEEVSGKTNEAVGAGNTALHLRSDTEEKPLPNSRKGSVVTSLLEIASTSLTTDDAPGSSFFCTPLSLDGTSAGEAQRVAPLPTLCYTPLSTIPSSDTSADGEGVTVVKACERGSAVCSSGISSPLSAMLVSPLSTSSDYSALLLQMLSTLARSSDWAVVREADRIRVEELRGALGCAEADTVAPPDSKCLRVSTTLHCSLSTLQSVMSVNLILSRQTSTSKFDTSVICASSHESAAATPDASRFPWKLQHLIVDGTWSTPPWDIAMRCGEVELSMKEGGSLGFHTPGIPAATYVWGGVDASEERLRDPCEVHERLRVLAFGIVAVAVPSTAAMVRVSYYLHLSRGQPDQSLSRGMTMSSFAAVVKTLPRWMQCRIQHLRLLSEAEYQRQIATAMLPVDPVPLLHHLYDLHLSSQTHLPHVLPIHHGDITVNILPFPQAVPTTSLPSTTGMALQPSPLLRITTKVSVTVDQLYRYLHAVSPTARWSADPSVHHVVSHSRGRPEFPVSRIFYKVENFSFPGLCFTVLEAFGFVAETALVLRSADGVPPLVWNCLNCDMSAEDSDTDENKGLGVVQGNVYCNGWVALPLPEEQLCLHWYLSVDIPHQIGIERKNDAILDSFVSENVGRFQKFSEHICTWVDSQL